MHSLLKNNYFKTHEKSRRFTEILIHTYREWSRDGTLRLGAGIAYYGIIALIPLLLVAVGIAEIFFSSNDISDFLVDFVKNLFGEQASELVPDIEQGVQNQEQATFTNIGLIGLGTLLFSATLIFIAVQDALNVVWKTYKGFHFSLRRYLYSFLVMIATGLSMTAILATHAVFNHAQNLLPQTIEIYTWFTGIISIVAVFTIITGLFMLLLKSFISIKLSFKDLFVSSTIISALMYLGVYGLAIYFSNFADKSIYGALTGLILILVAMYYFAQIFLGGAQLSKVLAYRNGNKHLRKYISETDPRTR